MDQPSRVNGSSSQGNRMDHLGKVNMGALEQPFSLLTIQANPVVNSGKKSKETQWQQDNLLTIRCLESSEKKMRLLKDLLAPEEFTLHVSKMAQKEQSIIGSANNKQDDNQLLPQQFSSNSIPAYLTDHESKPRSLSKAQSSSCCCTKRFKRIKKFSSSAMELSGFASSSDTTTSKNIREDQTILRRKALEFFHHQAEPQTSNIIQNNVTIELKSSVKLGQVTADQRGDISTIITYFVDVANDDRMNMNEEEGDRSKKDAIQAKSPKFAWFTSFFLIGFLINCYERFVVALNNKSSIEKYEAKFIEYCQSIRADSKQASLTNLRLIWRRLKQANCELKVLSLCNSNKTDEHCNEWILVRVRRHRNQPSALNQSFNQSIKCNSNHTEPMQQLTTTIDRDKQNLHSSLIIESNILNEFVALLIAWFHLNVISFFHRLASYWSPMKTTNQQSSATADSDNLAAKEFKPVQKRAKLSSSDEIESRKKVDYLYSKLFKENEKMNQLLTYQEKRAKLINRIDPSCLLQLLEQMSQQQQQRRKKKLIFRSQFELDPFVVRDSNDEIGMNLSLRQKLLLWRMRNNLSQLVHLNELENLKHFGISQPNKRNISNENDYHHESARCESSAIVLESIDFDDYRLIEKKRLMAANLVRKYEQKLFEFIEFESRKLKPTSGLHLNELLREPKLKGRFGFNWTQLHYILRPLFVPRRQARRPLMARANSSTNQLSARLNSFTLQAAVAAKTARLEFKRAATSTRTKLTANHDIESSSLNAKTALMNLSEHYNSDHLPIVAGQLVITVQQAFNVPVRIHNNAINQQQASFDLQQQQRVASPFLAIPQQQQQASPGSPSGNSSLFARSPTATLIGPDTMQSQLIAPTTYVELIFQRKHQATSLIVGKDPAWNETFFFPVEPNKFGLEQQFLGSASKRVAQIDEFLQFNLYDYDCYHYMNPDQYVYNGSDLQQQQQQQLNVVDLNNATMGLSFKNEFNNSAPRTISAMNKRIERHLLGTLRIPLATILNNEKIEGSFALNQPIFLDNYQFDGSSETKLKIFISIDSADNQLPMLTHNNNSMTYKNKTSLMYLPLHNDTSELQQVYEYARLWEQLLSDIDYSKVDNYNSHRHSRQANQSRSHRHMRALVLYKDFKYTLLSRFLGPIEAPSELIENSTNRQSIRFNLARFVSLMNPIKEGFFEFKLLDYRVCFDSQQLLEESVGGKEEKAILLCNYFLHLGYCSAILQGNAIPDGPCTYVIIWLNENDLQTEEVYYSESQLHGKLDLNSNLNPNESGSSSGLLLQQEQLENRHLEMSSINQLNFSNNLPILISAKNIQIWDPISAKCYTLSSHFQQPLPLLNVNSIVTPDNVYANIQATNSILDTNLDIRSRTNWFPLLHHNANPINNTTKSLSTFSLSSPSLSIGQSRGKSSQLLLNGQTRIKLQSKNRQLQYLEALAKSLPIQAEAHLLKPILSTPPLSYKPNYDTFSSEHAAQLRSYLEKAIKTQLVSWRHNRPTYFNRTLSRKLATKLEQMEDFLKYSASSRTAISKQHSTNSATTSINNNNTTTTTNTTTTNNDWRNELADLIRNYTLGPHVNKHGCSGISTRKIVSWPINISYTSLKPILDSLYASDIHNADLVLDSNHNNLSSYNDYDFHGYNSNSSINDDNNNINGTSDRAGLAVSTYHTQFLVSSYVHVHPAHIMSVWLYVAALVPVHPGRQRS